MNILLVCGKLDYSSGVTSYIMILINENIGERINFIVACAQGSAVKELQNKGIRIKIIEELDFEKRGIINYLSCILKISTLIFSKKIALIHSNNHYTSNICKHAAYFFRKTTLVQTIHDKLYEVGRIGKLNSQNIIFVNDNLFKEHWHDYKHKIKNYEIIYNGIMEFGHEKYELPENENLRFLCASRITKEKGIQSVIEAISKLPIDYRNKLTLSVAGKGDFTNELLELSKCLDVSVQFMGEVTNKKVLYQNCDVFILPSYNEGLPFALLEAISYGCFVISADFLGVEKIVVNDYGIIYHHRIENELVEKIKYTIDLTQEVRKLKASQLRYFALKNYSATSMFSKTVNFYQMCSSTDI